MTRMLNLCYAKCVNSWGRAALTVSLTAAAGVPNQVHVQRRGARSVSAPKVNENRSTRTAPLAHHQQRCGLDDARPSTAGARRGQHTRLHQPRAPHGIGSGTSAFSSVTHCRHQERIRAATASRQSASAGRRSCPPSPRRAGIGAHRRSSASMASAGRSGSPRRGRAQRRAGCALCVHQRRYPREETALLDWRGSGSTSSSSSGSGAAAEHAQQAALPANSPESKAAGARRPSGSARPALRAAREREALGTKSVTPAAPMMASAPGLFSRGFMAVPRRWSILSPERRCARQAEVHQRLCETSTAACGSPKPAEERFHQRDGPRIERAKGSSRSSTAAARGSAPGALLRREEPRWRSPSESAPRDLEHLPVQAAAEPDVLPRRRPERFRTGISAGSARPRPA